MKAPKYIYTYFASESRTCKVTTYEIRVYRPNNYSKYIYLGDELFDITCQSNLPGAEQEWGKGLRRSYGIRVTGLRAGHSESFKLASKLMADVNEYSGGLPAIIKRLKKLGAVRYALGNVNDPKSFGGHEWMPRKYAGKRQE